MVATGNMVDIGYAAVNDKRECQGRSTKLYCRFTGLVETYAKDVEISSLDSQWNRLEFVDFEDGIITQLPNMRSGRVYQNRALIATGCLRESKRALEGVSDGP
jgi:hypothetical protein